MQKQAFFMAATEATHESKVGANLEVTSINTNVGATSASRFHYGLLLYLKVVMIPELKLPFNSSIKKKYSVPLSIPKPKSLNPYRHVYYNISGTSARSDNLYSFR